jgi:hypothetical protein
LLLVRHSNLSARQVLLLESRNTTNTNTRTLALDGMVSTAAGFVKQDVNEIEESSRHFVIKNRETGSISQDMYEAAAS